MATQGVVVPIIKRMARQFIVVLNASHMQKICYCIFFLTILQLSCTRHSGPDYQMPPPPFLQLPQVATAFASNITTTSALGGGEVISDGGLPVTYRGICWSTSHDPTTALPTKTVNGSGTGVYISSIFGLTAGITYYIRAYATNSLGTAYGNEVGFIATDQPTLATLSTLSAAGITTSSASCGGNITSEGNVPVMARGICWSTNPNPTVADNKIYSGNGLGSFTVSITGLTAATTYHVRAWAVNSVGTAYGDDISFTTYTNIPPPLSTVTICSQVWMTKNLDVTTYRNGDVIPYVSDATQWKSLTTGAWTYMNGDASTNSTYGKVYNWYAVNDPRGLAPAGFHVPTKTEFTTLANCLGGDYVAGGPLKTTGTTDWLSPNTAATNSSGFAALPGGKRNNQGLYIYFGYQGIFWTSTEQSASGAWAFLLYYSSAGSASGYPEKMEGAAVRCVKD